MIAIGHRGAKGHLPENTLPSFAWAIELGLPWIELDVHLVEGRLVVIHDDELERTTNGQGLIRDASLNYLRSLDAGGGQMVPFLEEVLDLVDRRCRVNIELKGRGTARATAALIRKYQTKGWQTDDFLVSSFNHHELLRFKRALPTVRRGLLFNHLPRCGVLPYARLFRPYSLNIRLNTVRAGFVSRAQRAGYRVFVYTVNEEQDIARMSELGVDGVFSDYPERVGV